MRIVEVRKTALLAAIWVIVGAAGAQTTPKPTYLDTSLTAEQRAADLVHQMTLEEKATQLVNQARAIPRLNIPAYDWWSESLHGVAVNGTTEFPEPIGLGATFDPATIHEMGIAISTEGRIKHVQAVRAGHSNIFEGLDFWAPNINIFRDPRWGRGQETYGEDPFLTARMGVSFVTGMQGDDPRYYRVIATPKHFAVHSGPEPTRHVANVDVSKHDELDTYLPAFRAAIMEGKAASIMCAYNSINGQPACANEFLLKDQLRDKWGFKGYVVSDCEAVRNIFSGHHYRATQAEASAISLQVGMDNECIDFIAKVTDDHDYAPYVEAVKKGYLKESEIDVALTRLYTARIQLGLFDPPEMVPYTKIDEKLLDGPANRALARKLANESMVLLKNDGVLPLKNSGVKIAVVGPLADQTKVLLGNYNGVPTHSVSVLEGLKAEFPSAQIQYVQGTQFLSKDGTPVPASLLTTDGKQGVRTSYVVMDESALLGSGKAPAPLATRVDPGIGVSSGPLPAEVVGKKSVIVQSEATFTPTETGEYNLGIKGENFYRASLDGKVVTMAFITNGVETKLGRVHLEQGKAYALKVEYPLPQGSGTAPQLVWSKVDLKPSPEAVAAAKNADVVVAVVGITSELEGEEMPVNEDGFKGGDRTSLDLPKPEQDLLEAVAATGKPLVVVLMNGSALSVNWAKEHANAILEAWYSGEEGGSAIAETLSGRNNPAGRLPVTFYTGVSQLPPFEDYSMKARTYRYFDGTPLYPFGYGLSYTSFAYSGLKLPTAPVAAGDAVAASVTVANTGKVAGDEVVELYLNFPKVSGAPKKALRGFQRVHLEPGASQEVQFELKPRDLSIVTDAGEPVIPEGEFTVSIGGGQPDSGSPSVNQNFRVKNRLTLPE
ncbi:glycoside hydrolase family 3 C-terminal domain-containing protein [Tunturiibacter lichenicola]|uniref:glycoside hydrolase family 3 C-terminal domain-containing protein n=1 Tax=Tunturiibacter lichenicola TaxID=2051959 RepID=UPI003D9BD215